jgi:Ca2+-binding RTX toxin-like protein
MANYTNTSVADILTGTVNADTFQPPELGLGGGRDSFRGYRGDDYLYGGLDHDTLYGGIDNDGLYGGDGEDVLYGGDGFDRLFAGAGNDTLFGGNDIDQMTFSAAVTMTILAGTTTVNCGGFQITFSEIEIFYLADFANDITGSALDDRVSGGTGNDTLRGMGGNDNLFFGNGQDIGYGGDGNDALTGFTTTGNKRVFGGRGDDTIFMGEGRDTVYGGVGNDNILQGTEDTATDLSYGGTGDDFLQSAGGTDSLYGGDGNDTVSLYATNALTIDLRLTTQTIMVDGFAVLLDSFENAALQAPQTRITGNGDANTLQGYSGDDVISGLYGNDTFRFGRGADRIAGGHGNDFIDQTSNFSETGIRTTGDAAADTLTGGEGADTFRFLNAISSPFGLAQRDTITDFTRGTDKIDLSYFFDVNLLVNADVTFTFIGRAAFSGTRGELRFDDGVLRGDVNGNGLGDFAVNLTGVTTLSAADLIL